MVELLFEAAQIGAELPVETAREIAESKNLQACLHNVSPAARREALLSLYRRWTGIPVEGFGIAILTAAINEHRRRNQESIELVWTGPESQCIPVRQTEQVLLDLIRNSKKSLLAVSYAVFRIPTIRKALTDAALRAVRVRIVLDIMQPSGGDGYNPLIAIGQELASQSEVLYWPEEQRIPDSAGKRGILHVKCLVADGEKLFISSANLTEQAFKLNMELGVIISGGRYPSSVEQHFIDLQGRGVLRRL
jgi:phosphatidylserine/phosphatidylglycerophosphate/cardiolipin synthase-like enzyme